MTRDSRLIPAGPRREAGSVHESGGAKQSPNNPCEDNMTDNNLEPCPFCNKAPSTWEGGWRFNLTRIVWAGCSGTKKNPHNLISMPIEQWNTRTTQSQLLEAVKEALPHLREHHKELIFAGRTEGALRVVQTITKLDTTLGEG